MYQNILVAIDLNDETSCRKPPLPAVELARTFGARLHVLTVVREVDAILQAKSAPLAYELIATDLENELGALIRRINASDLSPNILVTHGVSIYAEILRIAEEVKADLVVVGSHRPAMKDYLLGTNSARVVRHARCSVLVAPGLRVDGGSLDIRGLSEKEAAARLKAEGPNTLPQADRRTFIRIVLEILREPMFALLLGAAAIYLVLGDLKPAVSLRTIGSAVWEWVSTAGRCRRSRRA